MLAIDQVLNDLPAVVVDQVFQIIVINSPLLFTERLLQGLPFLGIRLQLLALGPDRLFKRFTYVVISPGAFLVGFGDRILKHLLCLGRLTPPYFDDIIIFLTFIADRHVDDPTFLLIQVRLQHMFQVAHAFDIIVGQALQLRMEVGDFLVIPFDHEVVLADDRVLANVLVQLTLFADFRRTFIFQLEQQRTLVFLVLVTVFLNVLPHLGQCGFLHLSPLLDTFADFFDTFTDDLDLFLGHRHHFANIFIRDRLTLLPFLTSNISANIVFQVGEGGRIHAAKFSLQLLVFLFNLSFEAGHVGIEHALHNLFIEPLGHLDIVGDRHIHVMNTGLGELASILFTVQITHVPRDVVEVARTSPLRELTVLVQIRVGKVGEIRKHLLGGRFQQIHQFDQFHWVFGNRGRSHQQHFHGILTRILVRIHERLVEGCHIGAFDAGQVVATVELMGLVDDKQGFTQGVLLAVDLDQRLVERVLFRHQVRELLIGHRAYAPGLGQQFHTILLVGRNLEPRVLDLGTDTFVAYLVKHIFPDVVFQGGTGDPKDGVTVLFEILGGRCNCRAGLTCTHRVHQQHTFQGIEWAEVVADEILGRRVFDEFPCPSPLLFGTQVLHLHWIPCEFTVICANKLTHLPVGQPFFLVLIHNQRRTFADHQFTLFRYDQGAVGTPAVQEGHIVLHMLIEFSTVVFFVVIDRNERDRETMNILIEIVVDRTDHRGSLQIVREIDETQVQVHRLQVEIHGALGT